MLRKIDDAFVENEVEKLKASQAETNSKYMPQKDNITFDEFTKMDIRVGKILTAEKVEKADKLLKLTVDTGLDQRTIVSGIAEHYSAEEVIGKKVSVLMNLAPRTIRGVESQGMILMADGLDGALSFVSPEDDLEIGGEVR